MSLLTTNVINFRATTNIKFINHIYAILSFIENNEEIINDRNTSSMLVLDLQYFKTMLLSFIFV